MDSKVQARMAKQKTEIARLTQALEKCAEDKRALLADLNYWRDEATELSATLSSLGRKVRPGTPPTNSEL